jgi:Rap1a immunity proteins
MNKQPLLALAFCMMLSCPPSVANADTQLSGSALYSFCIDYDRVADTATCAGYVTGIENVMARGDTVGGRKACLSENLNEQELLSIVRDYLGDAREEGRDSAATLVARALAQRFPCKQ